MKISKSKRQLAQLLIEAGVKQFPEGANWVAQDKDDKTVYMHDIKPERQLVGDDHFSRKSVILCGSFPLPVVIQNWHQAVLNRAEFDQIVAESAEQSKPDADGWIEWGGGECPVDGDLDVSIKVCGEGGIGTGKAKSWSWRHRGDGADIVAYRLRKPEQAEPQTSESVTRSIPEPVTAPTLDQLLQDYRNASDFAATKQAEADEAAKMRDERWKAAQARACELGVRISVEMVVDAEMRESEPVITDWRDLRVGDVIAFTGNSVELEAGEYEVCDTEGVSYQGKYSIRVSAGELGRRWISNDSWRFIRRP